jgi:hypothetical protein
MMAEPWGGTGLRWTINHNLFIPLMNILIMSVYIH